ncbi:MAG: UDP-3-O-[3-hydroxymyristoyl] N-acetylglucosamine deacetylase [Firmicutes bacterium]|nr:UDP-3-O-[3-hydroxymyristoyl] N-acetylglucosamine deacetylase [Bacillota bacterium]
MAARPLERETTVARPVSYDGRGLHTGRPSRVTIRPAPSGTGIVFVRCDLPRPVTIPASVEFAGMSHRATGLVRDGVAVLTVEHLLAAVLWGGVDNALIEVDGEEIPLGDGSSRIFVDLVEEAGIAELERERRVLRVRTAAWVVRDKACAIALPSEGEGLRVGFTFVAARPGMRSEHVDFEITPEVFKRDIAPARTVGFEWELATLREKGLALGATPDEAVIVGENGYVGPARFTDEAARHKALDFLGDIALLGRVSGHFIGIGSGHALNHELARAIARMARRGMRRGTQGTGGAYSRS